jgi:hypothetical protein
MAFMCAQVRIKGFYPVGDKASGFVVFDIEVTSREVSATGPATIPPWSHLSAHASRAMLNLVPFYLQGTVFHALKRYSAFVQLRNDLLRALPNLKGQIPRLPPKSSLCKQPFCSLLNARVVMLSVLIAPSPVPAAKYRPSFLERRRQQLGFWLTSVLLHPEAGASTIMRAWVLE